MGPGPTCAHGLEAWSHGPEMHVLLIGPGPLYLALGHGPFYNTMGLPESYQFGILVVAPGP